MDGAEEERDDEEPAGPGLDTVVLEPVGSGEYEVREGDTMSSIAAAHGFFWETLWNDEANAALKAARQPEVLYPGDRVTIRARVPKRVAAATGRRHVFRRRGVPSRVSLKVVLSDGTVLGGKRYTLTVADRSYEGLTGEDGTVEHWVSSVATEGTFCVWPAHPLLPEVLTWTLAIGNLDPVPSITGLQARLRNLGYDCGEEEGEAGPETAAALRRFQRDHDLEPTGVFDEATKAALRDDFGI